MKGYPEGPRVDTWGKRVRWARQHQTKRSKAEVAKQAGIHVFRLTEIENGHDARIDRPLIEALANVLSVSYEWLRYGTDKRKITEPFNPVLTRNPFLPETPAPAPDAESQTMEDEPTTLSGRFKLARQRASLTPAMVARQAEVPIAMVERFETDPDFDSPKLSTIARVMNADVGWLREHTLAGRVRYFRRRCGLTEVDLAKMIEQDERDIILVETGGSRNPAYLSKLAAALKVREGYLLTGEGETGFEEPDAITPAPSSPASSKPNRERIREARIAKGMTQDTLGHIIGVSGTLISQIETGKIIDSKYLPNIAGILEVDLLPPEEQPVSPVNPNGWITLTPEIRERLEDGIVYSGIPKIELARRIGNSNAYITNLMGREGASTRQLPALARELNISLEWLLYGTGDMLLETAREEENQQPPPVQPQPPVSITQEPVVDVTAVASESVVKTEPGPLPVQPATMFHINADPRGLGADIVFLYERRVVGAGGEIESLGEVPVGAVWLTRDMLVALNLWLDEYLSGTGEDAPEQAEDWGGAQETEPPEVVPQEEDWAEWAREAPPPPEMDTLAMAALAGAFSDVVAVEQDAELEAELEAAQEAEDLSAIQPAAKPAEPALPTQNLDLELWKHVGLRTGEEQSEIGQTESPETTSSARFVRRNLENWQKTEMRHLAKEGGYTVTELARKFGFGKTAIRRALKAGGVATNANRIDDDTRNAVRKAWASGEYSAFHEVAEVFGISKASVLRIVKETSEPADPLPSSPPSESVVPLETQLKIQAQWADRQTLGTTIKSLVRRYKLSAKVIRTILASADRAARDRRYLTEDERNQITMLHTAGASVRDLSRSFDIGETAIRRTIKRKMEERQEALSDGE
jgi:transcriptional regulator with XRE-family HTH domain/Mor family transcriptional regulator